jgi:probable phosphoglycerate mutase
VVTLPDIYFLRHGETDWNVAQRLQGGTDIPLNARGRQQATDNGALLSRTLAARGLAADRFRFVASPMSRARETMERARAAMGLDPAAYATDPRLTELTFGRWEGFTFAELLETDQAPLVEARRANKWHFVPPGGESYEMLAERIRGYLADLAVPTVIVAHGGVFRAVNYLINPALDPDDTAEANVPQDRIFEYRDGRGHWIG